MTLRDVLTGARAVCAEVVGLAYPPTKKKFHRIFHVLATALTVATIVCTWLVGNFSLSARLGADAVLALAYLARWGVVVGKIDTAVDRLPIPEDSGAVLKLPKDGDQKQD